MVSMITGRTIREEVTEGKTYDVVAGIRATRLRWLGHILRMQKRNNGEERMIKKAVKMLFANRAQGDILMDAPAAESWEALTKMAEDKDEWRAGVKAIKDVIHIKTAPKQRGKGEQEKGKKKSKNKKKEQKKASEESAGAGRPSRKRKAEATCGQATESRWVKLN